MQHYVVNVETKKKAPEVAQNLIVKARRELADVVIQQQIIELVETIVLYKFPNLSREELEAMLGPVQTETDQSLSRSP